MDQLIEATARAEQDHFWFLGFRRFVTPLVDAALGSRTDAAILDCGCGTGFNLTWLRRYGAAVGIDYNGTALDYAHERGERAVARATAVRLPFDDARFDLVTSFDVIYSLEDADERTAIAEMFRILRPGGHLVLNVAAMELLRGNHSVLGREVRRYSRAQLAGRLTSAGFDVRRITYTNASIFPIVAGVRLLQRLGGHRESQDEISVPSAPVNAALSGMLAIEAAALRVVDMPFGSSLLTLARRPSSA
jgi:ubiquinone/menaquinone biosynthesis C-methylase UbiE